MYVLGFDIGGTKCAVVTARREGEQIRLCRRAQCATDHALAPQCMIKRLMDMADGILESAPDAIGISCGGPLDAAAGLILSPPNLPGWDRVAIVEQIRGHFGVPTYLQNDANACALAKWRFGAGQGTQSMVFLTFGTGLGAGLILNGRLYEGANANAGEVGHIRLAKSGPVGYGKAGSFEGFCSGNGIAQLALSMAQEKERQGECPLYYKPGMKPADVTAKSVAMAAEAGDPTACEVYRISGTYLGRGLAILMDVLNPEAIVIGSVFARSRDLLWEAAGEEIEREALSHTRECCRVVPAALGERIGDYAAAAIAFYGNGEEK